MRNKIRWMAAGIGLAGAVALAGVTGAVNTLAAAQNAETALEELAASEAVMATVYLTDVYPVKEAADAGSATVAELPSGSEVLIRGMELTDGCLWYEVNFGVNDTECVGYIEAEYLVSSNSDFLAWRDEMLLTEYEELEETLVGETDEDILAFPESYRAALARLKSLHPTWTFVAMKVNEDFDTVIDEEMVTNRSLVYETKPEAWRTGDAVQGKWYQATRAAVEYCVDPRNFLTESSIFMFEQLTYNASYHTADAVQAILKNSFMSGTIPGETVTYAQEFYLIGKTLGVSPYHLACRVYQEQGSAGKSSLISGTYAGYEGYYNYFNIGASGSTDEAVITGGLTYAKQQGWNSIIASLTGGAKILSANYILKGQDTLYLQKFDVDNSYNGMFAHQYQQNITAPQTEGASIYKAYKEAGALENSFVFKIPVYENMPETACEEPTDEAVRAERLRAFIERLYEQALGREDYDSSEVDYWYELLSSGERDGASAAQGFFFSDEFQNKNLSDEEFVDVLYRVMFNREADEGGKSTWIACLASGMTREYVYRGFANSTEFANVCADYGVTQGTITLSAFRDQNEGVTGFVYRLYNKLLDRAGEDEGMENWCRVILTKEASITEVAHGFVFSDEFIRKELSNEDFVKKLYLTFMDREYDEGGLTYWVGLLDGGTTREDVFLGFANSTEFGNLVSSYGLSEEEHE